MLIDELQKANIEALKAHDSVARGIYSIVISKFKGFAIEQKAQGIEAGDIDLIKIISKIIKELDEEKEGYLKVNRANDAKNIDVQKSLIEKYLPKMLSEDEIRKIIDGLEDKSMPSIMKYFKTNYDGQVDMGIVSKIARGQ